MALGPSIYDAAARAFRALPRVPGKWHLAGRLSRVFRPLRGAADPVYSVRMRDGSTMMWDLRDPTEARAVWLGEWDDPVRDAVVARLGEDAVMLDVGANVGAWTVPLARSRPRGQVFAFEPVPANRQRLEGVIAANALQNVTVIPIALGARAYEAGIWLRSSQTGADTGTAALTELGEGHITVTVQTLDSWMEANAVARCDFIKIDVEGSELHVLRGAAATVARCRPLILAEFDEYWMKAQGVSVDDAVAWARDNGYEIFNRKSASAGWEPALVPQGDACLLVPQPR